MLARDRDGRERVRRRNPRGRHKHHRRCGLHRSVRPVRPVLCDPGLIGRASEDAMPGDADRAMRAGATSRRPSLFAVAVAVIVLHGCSLPSYDSAVSAITNGTIDTGDPEVVALVSGTRIYCSGTLVAPRVVVTAGHCVSGIRPDRVLFGTDAATGRASLAVAEAFAHPGFDRQLLRNDVGVVVLSVPAAEAPAALPPSPLDGLLAGQTVRIVGFGVASPLDGVPLTKREGTTTISAASEVDFTFHPDPSQTCAGDSGGAAFMTIAGHEYLVGVTSAGDLGCVQYGRDMRVDAFVDDFIQPSIEQVAEDASAPAGCSAGGSGSPSGFALLGVIGAMIRFRRTRRGRAQGRTLTMSSTR
ncbi:MAG: S1 family peptidase [Deltaproteobacteria bacterium]|nr:MAG: S1 family peptidase [Deltaproteobacteria bacterium]